LPSIVGFTSITQNFPATIQNTSWEFLMQTVNIKSKQFSWSTRFNFTIPKNKVLAFPGIEKSSYANSLIVGHPLGLKRNFRFAGVDPNTGNYMFFDSKGNPTPTPSYTYDYSYYPDPFPHFYGGMENVFNYKNFELSFSFQFVKQNGANYFYYNGNEFPGNSTLTERISL
jgi:hypothetical protein